MSEPIFSTTLGKVQGATHAGVTHIAGLRYAQAPVGARRFRPPEPVAPWSGVLQATSKGSLPPQNASRLALVMGDYPGEHSEDCLHVDIWVSEKANGPLPVFVFIHGGAYMTGGGSMGCYDGAEIAAKHGVVVVNVSYRLGVLGYLPIQGMAPANLGLRDQVAALEWVRREIAAFGGDSQNVTVCGQSAGAYSIAALLALSKPRQLFDKAAMLSVSLGVPLDPVSTTEPVAAALLESLGVAPGNRAALEAVPVEQLLATQTELIRAFSRPGSPDDINPVFRPVIDGELLLEDPAVTLSGGKATWCPIIIGATREEHLAFYYRNEAVAKIAAGVLEQRYEAEFPGRGAAALAAASRRRPGADAVMLLSDIHSERRYIRGSVKFADQHVAAGGTLWFYSFDWQSPNPEIGACHCIELPFLFGNLPVWKGAPMLGSADSAELAGLSDRFQSALMGFAKNGSPEPALGLPWPTFGSTREVMHFGQRLDCGPYRRFEDLLLIKGERVCQNR